jgi:hypothetical protein
MPGLADWAPYKEHVQGGLREGNFINGQFVLICAGPPHLSNVASGIEGQGGVDVVYPIGLTQNITVSQNKAISRLFEIGSDRSYFISGRTVGQVTLFRPMYHGPSLLRLLYAYYSSGSRGGVEIPALFQSTGATDPLNADFDQFGSIPASENPTTQTKISGKLHEVQVPPGFDNAFINLASDLFSQPIGLLLVLKDNAENNYSYMYLEQCYVPTYTMAVDSQGLIVQESVGIQYERMVPIKLTQVALLDKILPDIQGAGSYPASL